MEEESESKLPEMAASCSQKTLGEEMAGRHGVCI